MRLDIRYRMAFRYDHPVWEAQNEIRVRPRDDERQRVIAYRLTPAPSARVMSFIDYWGTTVDHVGIRQPHLSFELVAEAAVETQQPIPPLSDPPLTDLQDPSVTLENAEYLSASPHVDWDQDLGDIARSTIAHCTNVGQAIGSIIDAVRARIMYESGSTHIGISVAELYANGRGVCQDYAHLTIAMLRAARIPARYVSGYLFATDETDGTNISDEPVRVQTHAWIEALIPGHGWHPYDPTNGRPVGGRHVVIGHGRDYDDVAPVRGVYLGEATPEVDAEVEIRRMEPAQVALTNNRPRRLDEQQMENLRRAQQQQQQQ